MEKIDIIELIGNNVYYTKSIFAQITALSVYYSNTYDEPIMLVDINSDFTEIESYDDIHIPSMIEDIVWNADISDNDKINLVFSVYKDIPEYGLLQDVAYYFPAFVDHDRFFVLENIKQCLIESNLTLSRPLYYTLAVDFFVNTSTVKEVWNALTEGDLPSSIIQSVLENSGAVPWELKMRLYQQLLSDHQWHPYILRSLRASAFQLQGKIDPQSALRILHQLDLSEETSTFTEIEQRLLILGK